MTLPAAEGAVGGPTGVEKVYLSIAPERSEVVDSAVRLSCDLEDWDAAFGCVLFYLHGSVL